MILGVAVLSICLSHGVLRSVCLSVCLCVCLSTRISLEPLDRSSQIFCEIPCVRGSVLLRRRCATLCTSVLMDDVTVGRNGPYVDAWKAEPTTSSGVAISGRSLMSMNALLLFVQYSIQTFGLAVFQPRLNFSPKLTEAATKTKILEY